MNLHTTAGRIRPVLSALLIARLFVVVAAFGFVAAQAAHKHHDGHQKVNLHRPGPQKLHQIKNHATHAHVNKYKKVTGVTVKHHKGHFVKHRKVKTSRRVVSGDLDGRTNFVSSDLDELEDDKVGATTTCVGFAFNIDGHWYVFWFRVGSVEGGDSGATDYDDLAADDA